MRITTPAIEGMGALLDEMDTAQGSRADLEPPAVVRTKSTRNSAAEAAAYRITRCTRLSAFTSHTPSLRAPAAKKRLLAVEPFTTYAALAIVFRALLAAPMVVLSQCPAE
jgi:hypothetical protein